MKKPLNLFFRFIIIFGLVFTVGNLLAHFIYKDSEMARHIINQTYITALFIVPLHHYWLRRKYAAYVKKQRSEKTSSKKKK